MDGAKIIFPYPSLITNNISKVMANHSTARVIVLGNTGEEFYSFMYKAAKLKCPDADIHTIIFGGENANYTELFNESNGRIWLIAPKAYELQALHEWETIETENYKTGASKIYYPHLEFHEDVKLRKINPISIDTLIAQFHRTLNSLQDQINKTLQIEGCHRILFLIDMAYFNSAKHHPYNAGLSPRELKSAIKSIMRAAQRINLVSDENHRISSSRQSLVTLVGIMGKDFQYDSIQAIYNMWV